MTGPQDAYVAMPLVGLLGKDVVPLPLYLRTVSNIWGLYCLADTMIDESHLGR